METTVYKTTKAITDQLSTDELRALFNAEFMEEDPTHTIGYDKAKSLFTERNGTRMHNATFTALTVLTCERLDDENAPDIASTVSHDTDDQELHPLDRASYALFRRQITH